MTVVSDGRHVRQERGRRVGHDRLDAADVVADAALDLAGPRVGEEAQRHRLEVPVEGHPQVVHDPLSDDVRQVGLPDADARS